MENVELDAAVRGRQEIKERADMLAPAHDSDGDPSARTDDRRYPSRERRKGRAEPAPAIRQIPREMLGQSLLDVEATRRDRTWPIKKRDDALTDPQFQRLPRRSDSGGNLQSSRGWSAPSDGLWRSRELAGLQ